jgi:hypothetical protein
MSPLKGANTVTLKQQRSIWESDRELVKRSGRDELIWVVTHLCMEAILGISPHSYPYLNWQKRFVFLIITYVYSSTKLEKGAEQVLPRSKGGGGKREEKGAGGRNDPNNECTYEYMNKAEIKEIKK